MSNLLTLDELRTILRDAAGADDDVDLDGDIGDIEFADLGYDSLALLETCGRIERAYGTELDDAVESATTPRALVDLVNSRLAAA